MALVAYDNSDSSEYEDDEKESISISITKENELVTDTTLPNADVESHENQSLFNHLPSAKKKAVYVEDDDEFLHKKESTTEIKPKSKITIPSLNDFKDVESTVPSSKTRTVNVKKSGLLNILPQPKNAVKSSINSFIPNAVKQKSENTTVKKKEIVLPSTKTNKANVKSSILPEYSDESDDDIENDFFSINKPVDLPEEVPLEVEENVVENTKKEPRSLESYFKKDTDVGSQSNQLEAQAHEQTTSRENTDATIEYPSNDVLDEEAILKLCGTRGKRKREEIQVVDVNQQEVLNDARQWLLKGLMDDTTKRPSASKKKGNEPTSQQKRKHQITYLAHQAKANEAELQNQWANNRMSKRQTQSKYGF